MEEEEEKEEEKSKTMEGEREYQRIISAREEAGALVRLAFEWRSRDFEIATNVTGERRKKRRWGIDRREVKRQRNKTLSEGSEYMS